MNRIALPLALLALAAPTFAQATPASVPRPAPSDIVGQAEAQEWIAIAPEDLLVMRLAPGADGAERQVVIQLMPPPFSQGWVDNIRTLARAGWYDGVTVNRVQDNYVVQWGDPDGEDETKAKPLPDGLRVMGEDAYVARDSGQSTGAFTIERDPYAASASLRAGWPIASRDGQAWPVHCYGMVGVGRGMSPDTGSGAELYTVIGHAPRHLDRNIAVVGRIVEGMEHLSSLPRGHGPLGFYTEEEIDKRTPIASVRVASDLPAAEQPRFEYLTTEGETFARYADARANRRDPFFIVPAGGADVCNIPVPVRRVGSK